MQTHTQQAHDVVFQSSQDDEAATYDAWLTTPEMIRGGCPTKLGITHLAYIACSVDASILSLDELAVDAKHRSRGYASQLIQRAIAFAKQRKLDKVVVQDDSDHQDRQDNVYIKNGFQVVGSNARMKECNIAPRGKVDRSVENNL